jgi:hypothetical protein
MLLLAAVNGGMNFTKHDFQTNLLGVPQLTATSSECLFFLTLPDTLSVGLYSVDLVRLYHLLNTLMLKYDTLHQTDTLTAGCWSVRFGNDKHGGVDDSTYIVALYPPSYSGGYTPVETVWPVLHVEIFCTAIEQLFRPHLDVVCA